MMATLNISLPESMRAFVEEQARTHGYSDPSEYLRQLIEDAQSHVARLDLERQLLEGVNSGPPLDADEEYWARKQDRLIRKAGGQ